MPNTFAVIGLSLDIIGVFILFIFAPEKYPDPQTKAFFKIEDGTRDRWSKAQARRIRISRFAFILIIAGFSLQLLDELDWNII